MKWKKTTITLERVGPNLQVSSFDTPGLILSGSNEAGIMAAIIPALDALAEHKARHQIEAAAERAYMNNRAGDTPWAEVGEGHKSEWRAKVKSVLEAALRA